MIENKEKINACFIEDKSDLKIIYKKYNSTSNIFIPLDIETFLLCKKKNLKIFNFNKFIKNDFHTTALNESKRFKNLLRFKEKLNYSLRSEILGLLRFRLNSISFIIEITDILIKEFQVKSFIVSGIKKKFHLLHKSKLCTEIIENIHPDKVIHVTNKKLLDQEKNIFKYYLKKKSKSLKKKNKICISNGGYNFKRIIHYFKKKNFEIFLPIFSKLPLLENIMYFFRGVKVIKFCKEKSPEIKKKNFVDKINFTYKNEYDVSPLMNNFNDKLNYYFNDLNQKIIAIKSFVNDNSFKLSISNVARGLDGSILDSDIKNPTLCIPHGVISEAFSKNDIIYKKIIAEAVFNGESKYFAIQSKIMNKSLNTHSLMGKPLQTGNLIFSQRKNNFINKRKYILFATTLKGFSNLQFLGVDMFYEFWEILIELEDLSKNINEKIVIKLHPQFEHCYKYFKKHFKHIIFSKKKIEDLLKNALTLITLSSGTIEDALNSKVPVILYDFKKRYKQMDSSDIVEINKAVLYINEKNKFEYAIRKIRNSKKLDFSNYVYEKKFDETLNEKILPLIID